MSIIALFVGYVLGIATMAFCQAAKHGDELDAGLFLVSDADEYDNH